MAVENSQSFYVMEDADFEKVVSENKINLQDEQRIMCKIKTHKQHGALYGPLLILKIRNKEFVLNKHAEESNKTEGATLKAGETHEFFIDGISLLELRNNLIQLCYVSHKGPQLPLNIASIALYISVVNKYENKVTKGTYYHKRYYHYYKKWIINSEESYCATGNYKGLGNAGRFNEIIKFTDTFILQQGVPLSTSYFSHLDKLKIHRKYSEISVKILGFSINLT